ncbi:MAG: VanZ family protein [Gammaproteobacteria bacterium]|nr:VanZ family protein [Gammaproteobacteria bacterium]
MLLPLRYRRVWLVLFWLCAALIAGGSLLPEPMLPEAPAGTDKLEHFVAYLALTLLGVGLVRRSAVGRVAMFVFAFGASLEVAQGLLAEDRIADWYDLAANAAGVTLAAWFGCRGGAGWAARFEARLLEWRRR